MYNSVIPTLLLAIIFWIVLPLTIWLLRRKARKEEEKKQFWDNLESKWNDEVKKKYPNGYIAWNLKRGKYDLELYVLKDREQPYMYKEEIRELEEKHQQEIKMVKKVLQQERSIREKEERKRAKELIKERIQALGELPFSKMKYFYMYNYYPPKYESADTQDEWDIRYLIWNFKASPTEEQKVNLSINSWDPNIVLSLQSQAHDRIIPELQKCLKRIFSEALLKHITFVCLPASTQRSTMIRYEDFSKKICELTGMENGYNYIKVVVDGDSKHNGGIVEAQHYIDKQFFKGKYVVLFDDIITSGATLEKFKSAFEEVGAEIIAGIAIGKTKYEKEIGHPIDNICYRPKNIFDKLTDSNYGFYER